MGFQDLFRRKSLADLQQRAEDTEHGLKRTLGPINMISLGVGCIVGAGIFVVTGQAAAAYAGPAIILSFLLAGLGCATTGLCYAELSSMIPVAGSAYTYAYATLGEFVAWLIGWDLILEYLFGASFVAVGWSGYVVSFLADFGLELPSALVSAPWAYSAATGWTATGGILNLPAVILVLVMVAILVIGIRTSANTNNLIVGTKIAVLLLFIGVGFAYVNTDHWVPFLPENTGTFGQFGWSGVVRGAGVIFIAFIGFDAVSTAAQEARNPQRDVPIGILGSLGISTVLYVLVALVLTGLVSYQALSVPDPIAVGVNAIGEELFWLRPVVKVGAIAGLSSVVLVLLLGQPRIFYSMAQDGLLPRVFARVHPRFRTPHVTTIVTGLVVALVSALFPLGVLAELVSIGTLFAFVVVSVGVLVLRYREPGLARPFRTPWVPLVPVAGVLISVTEMVFLPLDTWMRLGGWMAIGLAIYFLYGRRHSLAGRAARG
ncbi:MAG TPA: amino acid permease [Myxococcota bacterium]|nr:amino acid permease [Myxococcota bacterium]HRY92411.1 amino acid permease [Myxococcota bacterium]HSA22657.1 amino acid permease [Myxococcota bacterium]